MTLPKQQPANLMEANEVQLSELHVQKVKYTF